MAIEAEWAKRASAGRPGLVERSRTPGSTVLLLGCVGPNIGQDSHWAGSSWRADRQRHCLRYEVLAQPSWSVPCQATLVIASPAQPFVPGARADLVAWGHCNWTWQSISDILPSSNVTQAHHHSLNVCGLRPPSPGSYGSLCGDCPPSFQTQPKRPLSPEPTSCFPIRGTSSLLGTQVLLSLQPAGWG